MDINQLKYFISVAQTLSFTEAAKRNDITQPSISHHIAELEKLLGTKLFIRDKHTVALTIAGRELLPYAMEIVETTQSAMLHIRRAVEGNSGRISVCAVSSSSETLSRCLSVFSKKYPDILIDINFTSVREQIIAMNENKYDFHFALQDMVPSGGTFDSMIINEDELCLILPKGHHLAQSVPDFSLLKDEHFLIVSEIENPALHAQIMNVCHTRGYEPKIINRFSRAEAVMVSVSAGLGISIIPRAISKVFLSKDVDVVPITGEGIKRIYVAAWHRKMTNPAAELFLNVIKDVFKEKTSTLPALLVH